MAKKKTNKKTNSKKKVEVPKKRTRPTKLKVGMKVWVDDSDEEDTGEYEIVYISLEDDSCWLAADLPHPEDPELTRSVEQELPLSWVEDMYDSQN